ncbi:hypothetical protein [Candidatus Rhodobacter oscarellae]|nr:hypothetical protein [Candidatus Rhodobacter lobularis]
MSMSLGCVLGAAVDGFPEFPTDSVLFPTTQFVVIEMPEAITFGVGKMSSTAFWLQAIAYTTFIIVILGQYRGWW